MLTNPKKKAKLPFKSKNKEKYLNKLALTDGKVHFIRRVDNDGQINVLNETFSVGKEFISEYVRAAICLG